MAGPVNNHHGPPAPDGGWGWIVVFSSFLLQALTIGITYTFGVLFVALLEEFQQSEAVTSWIGSIQPALLYFTGIVAGPLIKKFGWRLVTVCGSVISALGFFLSSFSPNVYLLYLTYGGLTGIGNGLMYVTSMVAVQHWFDKRRAMATGLAVSGSGVGTLTFGYVTQKLVEEVGWRNTVRIQAAIILLGIICGLLYRPLPDSVLEEEKVTLTKEDSETEEHYDDQIEEKKGCCAGCTSIIDTSLFKNPIFNIFCISIIMFCFGYHVPYTYTPDRAMSVYQIEPAKAAFLVSIMGISNLCSRLIFGWVGDRSPTIRFFLGGSVLTLGGLVSCFSPLYTTYSLMVLYSVLFGAFTGCWASLFPAILVDLLGVEVIEQSLGQCLSAGSIAFLLASPMSGLILEKTKSYDIPFIVVGAAEAVGGLLFIIIWFLKRRERAMEYEEIVARPNRRRYYSESFS